MKLYTAGRARRALLDTTLFRALAQIATVAGFVIFVRAMPEDQFGVFSLLYAFIPMISTLASLGIEQTLRRYQPEYLSKGNVAAARRLVQFAASARFGSNVILLAAILLTWNLVAPIFKLLPYRLEFAFFCLLVLLHFQARILQFALAGNMLHRFSMGSIAMLSILKLMAYAALAWYDALTLGTAIFADTMSMCIAYLFLSRAYRKHCAQPIGDSPYQFGPTERKRLFRYGILNNFNDAGSWVIGPKSDNFFIAAFLDPVAVGVYAFYTRLGTMIWHTQPARLFENVIQPLFFAVSQSEADARIPRYFTLLLNSGLLLQWPALTYAVLYHAEIVSVVFGGKFADYSELLPLIVAFTTLEAIARPVTLVAQYEEKAGIILLSKAFTVYHVIALLVLVPAAGVFGAAVATGSAALFKNLFVWLHVRDRARWLNWRAALLSSAAIWGTVSVICFQLKTWLDVPELLHLLIGAIMCGLAMLLFVRSPVLGDSDRQILSSVLSGRESRLLTLAGLNPRPNANR
jgi:O-antigen/teichoic acid export membrane protein